MKQFTWIKNRTIISLISLIIIIIAWNIFASIIDKTIVLPTPLETLQSIIDILKSKNFINILWATVVRTIISFIAALFLGIIIGTFAGINNKVESAFLPIFTVLRTVPTMAVILLVLIWLGGERAPILISFLVIFPIIYINVIKGVQNVDYKLLEMASIYNVPKKSVIKNIYFASMIPYLIASINSALGLGFKVTVAAEVLGDTKYSIGKELQLSSINLDMPSVFGWAIILIIIVIMFDLITKHLTKLL